VESLGKKFVNLVVVLGNFRFMIFLLIYSLYWIIFWQEFIIIRITSRLHQQGCSVRDRPVVVRRGCHRPVSDSDQLLTKKLPRTRPSCSASPCRRSSG